MPVKNYKQIGTTGLRQSGGQVFEDFLPNLRWPQAGRVYQEMSDNDPVVGAILYLAEMLIRNIHWSVKPASNAPEDLEAANFVEECMNDMEHSWANFISEVLSMLAYGFSFHEIVYKVRKGPFEQGPYKSKYQDGRVGWKKLPVRSQHSLHNWDMDIKGELKGFVQLSDAARTLVTIPISKGLLFRTRVSRDNPEGKSLLRNAYRPWYFKKHIEEIEGIGIERDLAGFPVLTAPEGLDLWNSDDPRLKAIRVEAETLVANIRRDSEEGVLLPHGWDLRLLSTGSARQFDTNAIINRYDNRIAITMLSDLILIGSDKTGSFALAETKQSMLGKALEAQVGNIADVLNQQAIPKLFKYNNFTISEYPKILPGEIESPSIKEISLLLRAMGLDISKDIQLMNYLRRVASMPELDQKTFEEVYSEQQEDQEPLVQEPDDTAENDFEQNDMAYEGGE